MQNLLFDIPTNTYQALSESERYLFDYIYKNLHSIPELSIVKLSEESNVSTATIVRLMKKMGYDGYSSFKFAIKGKTNDKFTEEATDKSESKINQAIKKNEQEVLNTISLINIETLEAAIKKIKTTEKIYIFARGLSELTAQEMAVKLQIIGKNCEIHTDPNIIRTISKRLQTNELAIFISLNGETKELVDACKNFKIKQIPTITVTTNSKSSLAQFSDITLVGFKSTLSFLPDYEVRSRLPLEVITRILIDAYIIQTT